MLVEYGGVKAVDDSDDDSITEDHAIGSFIAPQEYAQIASSQVALTPKMGSPHAP